MKLFSTVEATPIAPGIWEVKDAETRYFVTQAAIDDCDEKYADDDEGEGYAAWCRNTAIATGLGEYGIGDRSMTPKLFSRIAEGLDADDPRREYAEAHAQTA